MSESQKHISTWLGRKVREVVTGWEGVVTSVSFDVNGCVQAAVTRPSSDGDDYKSMWFDVVRLEIKEDKPVCELPDFARGYIAEGRKGASFKPCK